MKEQLDHLQRLMVQNKYALVARTVITTDDFPYHVEVQGAECHQAFFHLPGKAVFIEFEHHSHHGFLQRDETEAHWGVGFRFEHLPTRKLLEKCFNKEKYHSNNWDFEGNDCYDKIIPGYNKPYAIPEGFYSAGYMGQHSLCQDRGVELTPAKLVAAVNAVVSEVLPYLERQFWKFAFTWQDLAPDYTFKGCEQRFGEQFDKSYFYSLFSKMKHPDTRRGYGRSW